MQLVAPPAIASPARRSGLSLADAPPPGLPAQHFAGALTFLVGGSACLVHVAPELATGAFFLPEVVAAVHLFTLGWIVLSIFGALCQFLPVAVGRPLRFRALAHLSFGLQVSGAAAFVAGLHSGQRALVLTGAVALSAAFVTFAANLASTLASARERSLTWWALAGAAVFLVVTPAYGFALALNLHDGGLGAQRFALVAVHAHIAIVGFVLLVMVGVAQRLLPMFLLSHGASERPGWIAAALLFSGALALSVPGLGQVAVLIGGALASSGVVAFLVQAFSFFRHRKRLSVDPGMRLAAAGLVGLATAVLVAPFALSAGLANPRLLTSYFVLVLGGIAVFISGHYYKIVPFLTWYHRFGSLLGKRKVPKVSELVSPHLASANALLIVSGWLGLALSTYVGSALGARISAFVFGAGAVLLTIVMVRVAVRKHA